MTYAVKELFYTLQGEGARAGRASVFCRFAGCNLWSGRESDRASATCRFCDTSFVGVDGTNGGRYPSAAALANAVDETWPRGTGGPKYVVLTGGEPLLQVDRDLVDALHDLGFEIAIETNGTLEPPPGIDWICVSPKAGADFRLRAGNEIKVVYPQEGLDLMSLADLPFDHRFIQPMDGTNSVQHTRAAVEFCLAHPQWRLSLQTHKLLGIA